jgi:hypothetical protein
MHIIMRRFPGAAHLAEEGAEKVRTTLFPLLQSHQGWMGYFGLPTEQGDILTCTMYSDAAAAQQLSQKTVAWVRENMSKLPTPEVFTGEVGAHMALEGREQGLYCIVRQAENAPPPSGTPFGEKTMNSVKDQPGLKGIYYMRSVDDPVRVASIICCETRDQAMSVHEATVAFVQRSWPQVTVRVVASGEVILFAMP